MAKVTLPTGYRFRPTDEEIIMCYLKRQVMGKQLPSDAVSEIKLYEYAPWDFRGMSQSKDLESYFFCSPYKKYKTGSRICRAAKGGYWKATGEKKLIEYRSQVVGSRTTLIFYKGKPPSRKCDRTDWVMHEYRLGDQKWADDKFVLCKVFEKSGRGPKNGEQHGAPFEEEADDDSDDDDLDDNVSSLIPHPVANPSSSFVPEEGQDAAMISTTNDSGDGQDSTFHQYSEAPVVSAQYTSLEHDDVHSNVSDEDGDTNGNDVQQVDSIVPHKTTVEDADEIFKGLPDINDLIEPKPIDNYWEYKNMCHQTLREESYLEMNDLNDLQKPVEVDGYVELNDLLGPHSNAVFPSVAMDGSSEFNLGCVEALSDSARLHKKGEIRGPCANPSSERGKQIKVPLCWECVVSIGAGSLPNGNFLFGFIHACSASVQKFHASLECEYYRGGWASYGSNIRGVVTVIFIITNGVMDKSRGTFSICWNLHFSVYFNGFVVFDGASLCFMRVPNLGGAYGGSMSSSPFMTILVCVSYWCLIVFQNNNNASDCSSLIDIH